MSKILIKGAKIISPENKLNITSDLLIENGVIISISKNIDCDKETNVINANGLTLVPGLVDMHTHLREPGQEYKESIYTGTRAAAKGGFTSVACMANTSPVNDNPAITISIFDKSKTDAVVNVYPIGAITKHLDGKELVEIGLMKEAGCVAFSDDGKGLSSARMMNNAMLYAKQFDSLIISHCEDEFGLDGSMNEGVMSTKLGLKGISRVAEEIMVFREVALAEDLGAKVHIAHISTKGSVEIIRNAKRRGVNVTCETCPHYICGTDEMVSTYDTSTKVNPPLREESDRQAIIAGIVDGTIDVIATDHAPHHKDDKNVEYPLASNGISGFETAFSLCYTELVEGKQITLEKLIELMSIKPSKILSINGGTIEIGNTANLTLIDINKKYKIDVSKFVSKGKNNPFDNREVTGEIAHTIVNGEIVYSA